MPKSILISFSPAFYRVSAMQNTWHPDVPIALCSYDIPWECYGTLAKQAICIAMQSSQLLTTHQHFAVYSEYIMIYLQILATRKCSDETVWEFVNLFFVWLISTRQLLKLNIIVTWFITASMYTSVLMTRPNRMHWSRTFENDWGTANCDF